MIKMILTIQNLKYKIKNSISHNHRVSVDISIFKGKINLKAHPNVVDISSFTSQLRHLIKNDK